MVTYEDNLTWTRMNHSPWATGPNIHVPNTSLRDLDKAKRAAAIAEYMEEYGHLERRHAEIAWLYGGLKVMTAIIAGLVMALGFYPIFTMIAAVAVWRSLDATIERHDDADAMRRAQYGVD